MFGSGAMRLIDGVSTQELKPLVLLHDLCPETVDDDAI
jgi:hypothetical protein